MIIRVHPLQFSLNELPLRKQISFKVNHWSQVFSAMNKCDKLYGWSFVKLDLRNSKDMLHLSNTPGKECLQNLSLNIDKLHLTCCYTYTGLFPVARQALNTTLSTNNDVKRFIMAKLKWL